MHPNECGRKREKEEETGKRKEGDRKEEWNWKLVPKSNFRFLEAANVGGRTAFAKDALCNIE